MKGCPKCGRMVDASVDTCPYCGYKFAEIEKIYKLAVNNEVKKINENAGLIQRLVAFNFDMLIVLGIFLGLYFTDPLKEYIDIAYVNIIYALITLVIYFIYCVILDASALKGTLGTRLLNIQVADDGGYQIGFAMSFKRNLFKILNILTLGIGYLALMFTKHKQTIADYFSDTYVENRSLEYNTKLYYGNLFSRFLAFVIDVLVLNIIFVALRLARIYLFNNGLITDLEQMNFIITIVMMVITIFYFTILDSRSGTIGKRLFSLTVADLNGENIGLFRAFIRITVMVFELLLLPLGVLLCLTGPTKQTFKDLVTKTVIIKRIFYK